MEIATAVKIATVAVKNKDKIGKLLLYVVLAMAAVFMLLLCAFLYIMSAFSTEGVLRTADYMDGANSAIYRAIQEVSNPFYEELEMDMEEQCESFIEEHTIKYDIIDDYGNKLTVRYKPKVKRRINYVPESMIIAYLMQVDGIDTKTAVIDKNKTKDFLKTVCIFTVTDLGNLEYVLENQILSEEQIANLYFSSDTQKTTFRAMCDAYADYFLVAETKCISDDGEETIESVFGNQILDVPLYLQYDAKWGYVAYGDGTIKKNGCCPTCLAMVFSYLCQRDIYPNDVVAWAGNRYYVNGAGTSWSIFEPAAKAFGVHCTNIGKDKNKMSAALSSGKLIVASMGPGTFTKGGHFIVLTGITESGKIKVNDPNDSGRKQHINKEFDISLILRESKNMWVFER